MSESHGVRIGCLRRLQCAMDEFLRIGPTKAPWASSSSLVRNFVALYQHVKKFRGDIAITQRVHEIRRGGGLSVQRYA